MAEKKKKANASAKNKGNQDEIEEVTLEQLLAAFRKECKSLNAAPTASSSIIDIFESYLNDEERGTLSQLCIGVPIDAPTTDALSNALQKSKYAKLKSLCFWRSNIGDAGTKAAGDIISTMNISKLEIRDSGVTVLGCEWLAKSILVNNRTLQSLATLKLDFNKIGSIGLLQIAKGLQYNRCIRRLSFAFCGICGDKSTVDALHCILSNCFVLESLNLENNKLMTKGCLGLISGIKNLRSTAFHTLDISSNEIGQNLIDGDKQILHALTVQFKSCTTLKKISMHGNFFTDNIADIFLVMLSEATHITTFTVPHTLSAMVVKEFDTILQAHKPKPVKSTKAKGKKKSKKSS